MLPVLQQLREVVWRERIGAAQRAASSYAELQLFTWLGIVIGLITTVLVAFSATEFGRGAAPRATCRCCGSSARSAWRCARSAASRRSGRCAS
jgi:hypothetical protein